MFTVLLNNLLSKACRASAQYLRLLCCALILVCTQLHAASDQLSERNTSMDNSSQAGKVVLVLGDSLSAAYGLTQEQGWVSLLQDVLAQHNNPDLATIKIINASISGETTDGGLARLTRLLHQHQPTDVLIELGGNDGLQGHSIKKLKTNLRAMIKQSLAAKTQVVVQQMQIPTNYGARYNNMFMNAFSQVATESQVPLVPFFLTDIALQPELMQNDGIHPTAEAQPLIAQFMLDNWIIPLVLR
jgi:acyl-CoA thioesterase-1